MRRSFLLFVTIIIFSTQDANCREITENFRGISDVWDNVKNSANNVWNSIQHIAQETKDKMNSWVEKLKSRANDINKEFENRINAMKNRTKIVIEEILGAAEIVKKCFEINSPEIEELLETIIKHVAFCISENMLKLSLLDDPKFELNGTKFIDDVETKLKVCVKDNENMEECANSVKKEMFDEMNNMENNILQTRSESRTIADDLLDAIISCSIDGLIDASGNITTETLKIIKCVHNG